MKKFLVFFFLFSFFTFPTNAEEVLTEQQQMDKKIQTQIASGLGTIKIFLSESGQCPDIFNNKIIKTWYTGFVSELSLPMEARKSAFELQRLPLQNEIDTLKIQIEQKNKELSEKKQAFIDEYVISVDNDEKLKEIDRLKNEVLSTTSQINEKTKQLKNIIDEFNSHVYVSKDELTKMYESKILEQCNQWYGKVTLTDKRTLEQQTSNLTLTTNKASTVPTKYKKIFDKIDLLYVKNPKTVKNLYTRLDIVVRKLSKTHKNYDILFELRKHIQTLIKPTTTQPITN